MDIYIFIYDPTFFAESALKLACERQRPGRDESSSHLRLQGFLDRILTVGEMQMNIFLLGQTFNLGIYYKSLDTSLMLHEDVVRMQKNERNLFQAYSLQ